MDNIRGPSIILIQLNWIISDSIAFYPLQFVELLERTFLKILILPILYNE